MRRIAYYVLIVNALLGGFGLLLPLCAHWFVVGKSSRGWKRVALWIPMAAAIGFLIATINGSITTWGINNEYILLGTLASLLLVAILGLVLLFTCVKDLWQWSWGTQK